MGPGAGSNGPDGVQRRPLRLELLQLRTVDTSRCLVEARARHLQLELRKAPLGLFPFPVEIIPDHPDDREEQEQARRREHDVQEVDVVGVADAFFVSHSQILKKNSGIPTMYLRLKIQRKSILMGKDIIIRNRKADT